MDQDDILWAQNTLLASGRRTPSEEVDAYRVLAQVGPAAYLPRLVEALGRLSYDTSRGTWHPASLALSEEAVAAARNIDPAEPARDDILYGALNACQRQLYMLGRRVEGLAMRAEMLAVGRAQAKLSGEPAVKGLEIWAAGLSEEGRYAESAEAMDEFVAAELPGGPRDGSLAWPLLMWIAALADAGRSDDALAAFETLVGMEAAEAANDRVPVSCHLYSLIGYARMLDTCGRAEEAAAVRQEALVLLTELAATGERTSWRNYQASFWAVLLSFPGAEGERPAPGVPAPGVPAPGVPAPDVPAPGEPRPPSGAEPTQWSPDVRQRYFDSRTALRGEVENLARSAGTAADPDEHLPELARIQRVLTVRSAVYWANCSHLFPEKVRPLFDDGVTLARRLSVRHPVEGHRLVLAGALMDRTTFHVAAGEFGRALDDFREALLHCVGEAAR
ncbi:hypothetical protein [Streptomyces sp. NPDC058382]|uniref:hypothetical protein n=1 Tax=unclassified Streptomyces TaxID=2593676 RepID=UPI0036392948